MKEATTYQCRPQTCYPKFSRKHQIYFHGKAKHINNQLYSRQHQSFVSLYLSGFHHRCPQMHQMDRRSQVGTTWLTKRISLSLGNTEGSRSFKAASKTPVQGHTLAHRRMLLWGHWAWSAFPAHRAFPIWTLVVTPKLRDHVDHTGQFIHDGLCSTAKFLSQASMYTMNMLGVASGVGTPLLEPIPLGSKFPRFPCAFFPHYTSGKRRADRKNGEVVLAQEEPTTSM